jgi:uncharacterized protein (TIGR03437 family)
VRTAFLFLVGGLLHAQAPWTMLRLPDTGQTAKYTQTPGEDSFYSINPPSFTKNADGTVIDNVTGLQWQQTDGGEKTRDASVSYCTGLTPGGYQDWRLPYAQELFSILKHDALNPAMDTAVFTKTTAEYWWSNDLRSDDGTFAWASNAGGGAGAHRKTETISGGGTKNFSARCVRSPSVGSGVAALYTDNPDGTVTDNRTGLMWQKQEGSAGMTWEQALVYANGLTFAGYQDWRLPNIKELWSLNIVYAVRPSINSTFFPATASALFWSSTTQFNQAPNAWTVDFTLGIASYNPKTQTLHVRLVRSGAGPRIRFGGIRNSAGYGGGAISPGEVVAVFGSQMGFPEGKFGTVSDGVLASSVEGRSVLFGGVAAPVISWQVGQANVIVPGAVAGQGSVPVTVSVDGVVTPAQVVPVAPAAPGLYTANASGVGAAAAFNADGSLNSSSAPVFRGAVLVFYLTGHGATNPASKDGVLLAGTTPGLELPVEVRIGGLACELLYAGLVYGAPAGLLQLNVRVPGAVPTGDSVPAEVRVGAFGSQAGVTVAIR